MSAGATLAVAALLQAMANDDVVAVADLMDTMTPAEKERALRQSLRFLVGYIEKRPGGMALWQQTWREADSGPR